MKTSYRFSVLCDNKTNFQICLGNADGRIERFGKSAVLVCCDRVDLVDNARGLKLAEKIADFLNSLEESERLELLSAKQIPGRVQGKQT